jgi:hypothetical protein
VADGQYTLRVGGWVKAFDSDIYSHHNKLEQVVKALVTQEWACRRNFDAPVKSVEIVATNPVEAGIGPAYEGWLSNGDPVQREASFCLV